MLSSSREIRLLLILMITQSSDSSWRSLLPEMEITRRWRLSSMVFDQLPWKVWLPFMAVSVPSLEKVKVYDE